MVRLSHPFVRHGAILALLVLSIGTVRAVYVDPTNREAKELSAREVALRVRLQDLTGGIGETAAWSREHPGHDPAVVRLRRALPARQMVSGFLRALAPLAERHGVATQAIEPAKPMGEEIVSDASGAQVRYRKEELRFRLEATYRDLAAYLRDLESMDQLVLVRSVGLRADAGRYPDLAADVVVWVYGTV